MDYLLSFFGGVSAVLVMALLAFGVPLWRDVIAKFIGSRINYGFENKIEKLRSELRNSEEAFRSQLRAGEQRVNSIVSAALTSLSGRQSAIESRRLQAIEALWQQKSKLDQLRVVSNIMIHINFEVAAKYCEKNEKARMFFSVMHKNFNVESILTELKSNPVNTERPFLSEIVWSLYEVYTLVVITPVIQLQMLATGFAGGLIKYQSIENLLRTALPENASYIDEHSFSAYHFLIQPLEEKLLSATKDMMSGKEADAESVSRASDILRMVVDIRTAAEPAVELPDDLKAKDTAPEPPR
jgi:hypothetical protein